MRVIILDGNENQTVAAVRSLAAKGHRVVVGADTSWSKAGWSRKATSTFRYPSPQTAMNLFIERILLEVAKEPNSFVLPMTERTTIPLSLAREDVFRRGGRLMLPPHETLLKAFDKPSTTELARTLGVNVPRTVTISNRTEASEFAATGKFPVVLKPRSSQEISPDGRVVTTGSPRYATNREEFLDAFDQIAKSCSAVVVQEFVVGVGTGYFALMNNGELRAEFAHRRIRDVRPTGSGSALRESVPMDPKLRSASLRILKELRWHGVAMVEFRQAPDGSLVFMEVNGRFWNSLPLAVYAGVDFPSLLVQLTEDGDITTQDRYRSGVRCRWLLGDFRHLIEVLRGAPKSFPGKFPSRLATLRSFLTPRAGTYHDNFNWNDPLPEIGDWLDFLLRKLPAGFKKKRIGSDTLNVQSRYSLP